MKRKLIFGGIAILLIAVVAAWNVSLNSQQNKEFLSIALENVEALTNECGDYNKNYVRCEGTDVMCLGNGINRCCR
jgi:hypothetical protein